MKRRRTLTDFFSAASSRNVHPNTSPLVVKSNTAAGEPDVDTVLNTNSNTSDDAVGKTPYGNGSEEQSGSQSLDEPVQVTHEKESGIFRYTSAANCTSDCCIARDEPYQPKHADVLPTATRRQVGQKNEFRSFKPESEIMGGTSEEKGFEKLVEVSGRNSQDAMYNLRWADGHYSRYPFVWLRDNCRCTKCYHPSSYQRLALMADLDPEVKPTGEEVSDEGSLLKVTWPDNHVGEYPSRWLRHHQFDKGFYDPIGDIKPKPWGSELGGNIPKYEYDDILNDDGVLFEWLKAMHVMGLAVLTGAPTQPGVVEAIGKRVAFLRETVYGRKFQIYSKYSASNVAYTSAELGLHVDLPYYGFCPGVQMLHCIRQTRGSGGDNQFADAFHAALILKKENPAVYKLLTTTDIHFRNCGTDHIDDYHLIQGRPIFEEDSEGNFKQVYHNNAARASFLNVPVEKVQDVYRAIKLFHQTLYKNNISIKLRDGEVATFNNTRVTHGRTGYTVDSSSGEQVRHYEGGYLEWDEINSRMRILREKKEGELRV